MPAGIDTRNAPRWMRPRQRGFVPGCSSIGTSITGGFGRASVQVKTALPRVARATKDGPSACPWSSPLLSVRDLVVEVGGKRIVEGVSLQVAAGDKIGLVGRNGAGKTTLLRVLGGAASPRAGIVRRGGATGYLSQDPRTDAVADSTTVLAHVLSGRGFDELQATLERLRVAMDGSPTTRNIE